MERLIKEVMQKWMFIVFVGIVSAIRSAEIRYVFKPALKGERQELIRLYSDNTYEYLIYTPVAGTIQRKAVEQTMGKYSLAAGKLKLYQKNKQPDNALFNRTLYIDNNFVYEHPLSARLNKKKFVWRSVNKQKFGQPYFLDPGTQKVVALTPSQREQVSTADLVQAIIEPGSSTSEKVKKIIDFIQDNTVLEEDIHFQLAGAVRCLSDPSSVVSKYSSAELLAELLSACKVQQLLVRGEVKESDETVHAHQWNAVTMGNNVKLIDFSRGKGWYSVTPDVMIYTHFPMRQEDQFIPVPFSKETFETSILMEPLLDNAMPVEVLPSASAITVDKEMTMIVKNTNLPISVMEIVGGTRNPVSISSKQTKGCSIIRWKVANASGHFQIKLGSVLKWSYRISKGEAVNAYLTSNFSVPAPVALTTPVSSVKSAEALEVGSWNEFFLSDLLTFQFPMNANLNHPLIKKAAGFYNLKEIPGEDNQKQIVQFFQATGNKQIKTDEDPWCSVFIAYCAKELGYAFSTKTAARSWLNIGKQVDTPKSGDIVIFWREDPNSWKGHVAIYLGTNEQTKEILCLGGNQGDKVCIQAYCMDHVLGYRRLK